MSTVCKSCGSAIVWATTYQGKAIPLDAEPRDDGNNIRLNSAGRVVIIPPGAPRFLADPESKDHRYVSHFATCPQAASHWERRGGE